jgi:peptide/nickel transport system permease protein
MTAALGTRRRHWLVRFPFLAVMLTLLGLFVGTLTFGPMVYGPSPTKPNIRATFHAPSPTHPLGTDGLGRDIMARVLHGGRLSLLAGMGVVVLGGVLGTLVGFLGGYYGGRVDFVLMRVTDLFLGFPALILAIALAAALGAGLAQGVVAASLVWWPGFARLVRGQVIATKHLQYVEAARALGGNDLRLMVRHILPACMGEITIKATLDVGLAVLFVASLGFLGLGAQPPAAEWGMMIAEARPYVLDYWWTGFFPGVGIGLTVILFNLLGDALQPLFRRTPA